MSAPSVTVPRRLFVALVIVVILVPFETVATAGATWRLHRLIQDEKEEEEMEQADACSRAEEARSEARELQLTLNPDKAELIEEHYASLPPPSACV